MSVHKIFTCDVCRETVPVAELEKSETLVGDFHLWRRGERKGHPNNWPLGIGRNRASKRDLCNDCCAKVMDALGLDADGQHPKDEESSG